MIPPDDKLDPERTPDAGFDALWERVCEAWDDDKTHSAFLEYARTRFLLPEAGARYREVKEREPARAEKADEKLKALMVLALSMLESVRSEPIAGTPRWITFAAFALCAALLAVLAHRVLPALGQ